MIIDFFDAIDTMLTALFVWIIIAALVATFVGLVVAWVVTRGVKRAWRALSGPCDASDAPDGAPDPHDAPEPADGRSSNPNYEEAA